MKKLEIDKLEFTATIGYILLSNGAETYRVEDTICRILSSIGEIDYEVFATSTGIFVNIGDKTKIKRIKKRNLDIANVVFVNDISRKLVMKEITLVEAKKRVDNIENNAKHYKIMTVTLAVGIACFFISLLYKGTIKDATSAFIVVFLLNLLVVFLERKNVKSLLLICISGAFVAFASLITINIGMGDDIDNIIISSVMPLLPGVCFTNAIRDIFEGDYISGGSRLFEALFIGIGLATGVGVVLSSWISLFGGFII